MAKKLFGKDVDPKCVYCVFAHITDDKNTVLCAKVGITEPESSCRKFSYDPLKRSPDRPAGLKEYSSEDFSL